MLPNFNVNRAYMLNYCKAHLAVYTFGVCANLRSGDRSVYWALRYFFYIDSCGCRFACRRKLGKSCYDHNVVQRQNEVSIQLFKQVL